MWKKEFANILADRSLGSTGFARANVLKLANIPLHLFKYRPVDDLTFDLLHTGKVWAASPDTFNDPLDSVVTFNFRRINEDIRNAPITPGKGRSLLYRMIQGETLGLPESFRDSLVQQTTGFFHAIGRRFLRHGTNRLREGLRISCFSETCLGVPMWAHYAGNHSGICIEWNLSSWDQQNLQRLYPVVYDEHPFQAPSLVLNPHNDGANIALALRKSIDWAYEREWRYIIPASEGTPGQLVQLPRPCAVHVGIFTKTEHSEKIQGLCREHKMAYHEVQCDQELGGLRSVQV